MSNASDPFLDPIESAPADFFDSSDEMEAPSPVQVWHNQIVGHTTERAGDLLPSPLNWRIHPTGQQRAMSGIMQEVGWVDEILVNRRTGHVIDGHMRIQIAMRDNEDAAVPVAWIDVDEATERIILATFNPLGAMAVEDQAQYGDLLGMMSDDERRIVELLNQDEQGIDTKDSSAESLPDTVKIAVLAGDRWRLGNHVLSCGDSTAAVIILAWKEAMQEEPVLLSRKEDGAGSDDILEF